MSATVELTPHQVRQVSVLGAIHPKTVKRYFEKRPVRSVSALRIDDALRRLGLTKGRK